MCTYIVGDIHGCYDEFIQLLTIIDYQDDDEIICVGDYIDRGRQNYEMLKWIENYPDNFLLIQGNHEAEFVANIEILVKFANVLNINKSDLEDTQVLYQAVCKIPQIKSAFFDGYKTIYDLIYRYSVDLSQLIDWSNIIKQFPYVYRKTIDNKKYIIVHAGYKKDDVDYYIYAREESFFRDSIVITGHTPTVLEKEFSYNNGHIYKKYNNELNSEYINIDCGCVYRKKYKNARLACLRIEDLKEFYI